jgi:hypothetical protein
MIKLKYKIGTTLNALTNWIGWALVELSVKLSAKKMEDLDGALQRISGVLYDAGCDFYGRFDDYDDLSTWAHKLDCEGDK